MVRFDWYQATIPHVEIDDVLEAFTAGAAHMTMDHRRGVQGYAHDSRIEDADGLIARVWHGGTHERPNVVLSGETTPAGVEVMRTEFPVHFVTRADACVDFSEPDAFDRIQPLMLAIADKHRVKIGTAGDHFLRKDEGRTLYLGSPQSAALSRLYDKLAQLRAVYAADPVKLAALPESLTRYEVQAKPKTHEARLAFATVEPLAVMGSSTWSRALWKDLADEDLEPQQLYRPWRQSDDDRAYSYALAQYGAMFERRARIIGWDCVGLQMRDDLANRAIAKRNKCR